MAQSLRRCNGKYISIFTVPQSGSNPDLTMLERLCRAMSKIPTRGKEVERLAEALTKWILELN
jgi:hypothetical protein